MKRFALFLASMLVTSGVLFAHGDNDHVRGVVTAVTPQSITVQVQSKTPIELTVTPKTTFEKSGARAQLTDLKVGDRVVIDVPKGTKEAQLVRFGPAKKAASASTTAHSHPK